MTEPIKIRKVDDLIYSLYNAAGIQKGSHCYRGQVNHSWQVLPSLLRKSRYEALLLQRSLLKRFLMKSNDLPYVKSNDPIEYFMVLQHFGIPTKLLDLTLDPLIALFFSCYDPDKENENVDGKVLLYPINQYEKLPINENELEVYNKAITKENINDLLWKRISPDRHLYFEPLIKNVRMRAQDGCFMFFSSQPLKDGEIEFISLEKFHHERNKYIEEINKTADQKVEKLWYAHMFVDKHFKKSILQELENKYGISAKSMFVENDYLAECSSFYEDIYKRALITFEELKLKIPKEKENQLY